MSQVQGEREQERDMKRLCASAYKVCPHSGVQRYRKARCVCVCTYVCVCVRTCSSEGAGVDNTHHHNVPDGGDDGDPEPNGIAGH